MKKLALSLVTVFLLFACDNEGMENEGYSLIGTWEAEGDLVNSSGVSQNYKSTLIFHNDTEYTHLYSYRKVGTTEWTSGESRGTYNYGEENISYVNKDYFPGGSSTSEYNITCAYTFTDRNTLITNGPILLSGIDNYIFRRKND